MPFANVESRTGTRRNIYLKIVSGIPNKIQILDKSSTIIPKHWITDGSGRRVGLICPGQDICPICTRNKEIGYNSEHPDFISRQLRHRVNVLDLTEVKRCPGCDAIYATTAAPSTCSGDGCGMNLSEVSVGPMCEVKILERGRTLMEQFNALELTPHPTTGNVEELQSYPIMLVATGTGIDTVIVAIPQAPTGEDVSEYEKFDLTQGLKLTPDEIQYLLNGGVLRDVLAARTAEAVTSAEATSTSKPLKSEDIPF